MSKLGEIRFLLWTLKIQQHLNEIETLEYIFKIFINLFKKYGL